MHKMHLAHISTGDDAMPPRQGLDDMSSAKVASSWQELIIRFESWDESAAGVEGPYDCGLSRAARASLLAELRGVAAGPARLSPVPGPWERWVRHLPTWPSSPVDECSRRQRALLGSYERLCELDLPLDVSNLLIRQYSAIRRATLEVEFRAQSPISPCGLVSTPPSQRSAPPSLDHGAVHNRHMGVHNLHTDNIGSRHRSW
jgi:hypothetical protein